MTRARHDHELRRFTEDSQVRVKIEEDASTDTESRDEFASLKESIDDLVIQMKILNKFMSEGFDMEITEEDII
jgi:hypothetical protein